MRNCPRKKRKNNPASKGTPWGCGHLHVVGPVSRLKKAHACMKGLALFRRKTLFLRSFVCPSPAPCSRRRFTGFESKSILLSDVTAKYTFFVSAVGAFCALPCPFLFAAPGWGSKSASGFCLHGQGACGRDQRAFRSPFGNRRSPYAVKILQVRGLEVSFLLHLYEKACLFSTV